jgi:hypothetical protein
MEQNILKPKKEGRSKETFFRVAYQHQGQLIQLADYKANLIISISATIISGVVALIGFRLASGVLEKYGSTVAVPVIIMVLSCLIALIYAIQAAKPKFVYSHPTRTSANRSSVLFFRSIATYTQPDYLARMKDLLDNDDDIYEQMTIDLYNQGIVLNRKYGLLRIAYSVLMVGFVVSVFSLIMMIIIEY